MDKATGEAFNGWVHLGDGYIVPRKWLEEHRPDLLAELDKPDEDVVD